MLGSWLLIRHCHIVVKWSVSVGALEGITIEQVKQGVTLSLVIAKSKTEILRTYIKANKGLKELHYTQSGSI